MLFSISGGIHTDDVMYTLRIIRIACQSIHTDINRCISHPKQVTFENEFRAKSLNHSIHRSITQSINNNIPKCQVIGEEAAVITGEVMITVAAAIADEKISGVEVATADAIAALNRRREVRFKYEAGYYTLAILWK